MQGPLRGLMILKSAMITFVTLPRKWQRLAWPIPLPTFWLVFEPGERRH